MRRLLVATKNLGKFCEIRALLAHEFDAFYSLRDMDEDVVVDEDSPLYADNAMKKARKVGDRFGLYTLADDSGLEVDALGGRPGIHSSRYGQSDKERIDRLLGELSGIPQEKRGAAFKAYLSFYLPDKERSYLFYGYLRGVIGFERHGEEGFGFDPVFYASQYGRYVAQLTTEEKNRISHRGRAIQALVDFLDNTAPF